jgi:hypothetical protein
MHKTGFVNIAINNVESLESHLIPTNGLSPQHTWTTTQPTAKQAISRRFAQPVIWNTTDHIISNPDEETEYRKSNFHCLMELNDDT